MTRSPASPAVRRCPMCGKPTDPAHRPFCGRRCADVDLQRWLAGVYVAPGGTAEDEETPPSPTEDED